MCKLVGLSIITGVLNNFSVRAQDEKVRLVPRPAYSFLHVVAPIDRVDPHYKGVRDRPEFFQRLSRSSKSQRGFSAMSNQEWNQSSQEWNQMEDLC